VAERARPNFARGTPPGVVLLIAVLIAAVAIADLAVPLGIAVWVFYLVPLGVCLSSRTPVLPFQVATAATVCTIALTLKPFGSDAVVEPWIAYSNRAMYVATLWPVAFMVRQLIRARIESEKEEWLRGSQANLLVALQGELSVAEVAGRGLRGIIEGLGAQVGALYLSSAAGLDRVATHALEADGIPIAFKPGEGLVGQAAEGGRTLVVEDVPEGFLRVQAGVGAGAPRHVGVTPLRNEGQTVAVVAFGSMNRIDATHHELLDRLSEPAARAITSAEHKARLRELLLETRRQADELSSQHTELEAQQAELEAQQAELEASNEVLSQTNSLMELKNQELERQRAELARERETAEQASRYKSEFLANMSHELRTPLNSSLILSRLLADNREGNLSAEQVRSAETIYGAGNDLLALINDILDLAKIEAGRADVNAEAVFLARLVEGIERGFGPVANEKGIGFRIVREAGSPERLVTDGRRLEQILKNLLSNAFKFTERGEVELRITAESASHVRFAVKDTGIGIPADQQAVIFEAFRQADGTTSRKYGGTGLGLSISRELVRLLGGHIEVSSVPGQGSTFAVVLPVQIAANDGAKPALSEAASLVVTTPARAQLPARPDVPDDRDQLTRSGRLILAIEDDAAFAHILYELAHELNFDCVVAGTGDDGFELAHRLQPNGILLDVSLPDASGLSVLERLKRDPVTRHVPIHMVSVLDNVQTALELGAIGYALKPVARTDLIKAIEKLEERHAREVRRVLVVEDDVRQQDSIKQLLRGQAIQLVTAGSVKEALATLEQLTIDCMVLDLTLPDGSGYDLLEKMAEGTRYSFPPVIVYTGRDIGRDDEERLRRYSQSIIVKGARSPERLLDEVTLFLHQVESSLPPEQRRILADVRQREAAFEGRRILIVEDDVRNVFALSKVLEPRGAKVEISRNGREAIELLERDPRIDLVLMDLMMPEMDGLTAIRELRKRPAFRRLPIIALTAKAMPDDRKQAIGAGANDYMTKPFDVDKLVSLCRVWLPR
jgi:signal transduction histidine kinase/DNA-binding response OmpR family regulator